MTTSDLIRRFKEARLPAAVTYGALVVIFLIVIWQALSGLSDVHAEHSAAASRLAALEGRGAPGESSGDEESRGSPFLDGPTVTIAGADLQRRVAAAVTAVGGSVLSSQVDLQGSQASEGYVIVTASCELAQSALQPLLYDLEGGMPFLFVEQLDVQSPQAGEQSEGKRMRVQIDVAGQWQVGK